MSKKKKKYTFEVGMTVKCKGFGLGRVTSTSATPEESTPISVEFRDVILFFQRNGKSIQSKKWRIRPTSKFRVIFGWSVSSLDGVVHATKSSAHKSAEMMGEEDVFPSMFVVKL